MSPRILLLRHGQILANKDGRWHGSTDSPLTIKGRWQAYLTGRFLAKTASLDAVYTSPLQRCRHTGALASKSYTGVTKVVDGLAEMSIGQWENMAFTELNAEHRIIERFNEDLDWAPPEGESLGIVASRMQESLLQIADDHSADETVLVVSHGAAMAVALGQLLHQDPRAWMQYRFDNCSLTEIRLGDNPSLEKFNDCSHQSLFG
ncbi:histidine phosphatase family protein [Pseudomonadales bacterium]|jgi:broad specificity phosphatase PhoE|nr:histidine phosphatase family protein [Pseudomonadales bacterium]MDB2646823.1 histidine phosphatase family protein [Pseudomonadales bacterium]